MFKKAGKNMVSQFNKLFASSLQFGHLGNHMGITVM